MGKGSSELSEVGFVKQRSFPSLYIVDSRLRVLFYAPGDQLSPSVPAYSRDGKLPEPLREAVLAIRATLTSERQTGVEIIPENSILVRVASGDKGTNLAIFVHEYRTRDGIVQFAALYELTPREQQVLLMLIDGHTTSATAKELNVAVSTVLLHIKSMLTKTRSHSRTELIGKVILHPGRSKPNRP